MKFRSGLWHLQPSRVPRRIQLNTIDNNLSPQRHKVHALAKYYKTNERFHKKLCLPAFSPHFNIPIVSCEVHWQRYYGHCHELGLLGVLWICDHLKLLIFLHLIYSGAEFTEPVFLIDAKRNVETAGPSSSRLGEYSSASPRATLYTIRSGDMT